MKNTQARQINEQAFTLSELLLVLAIMAILLTLAVPVYYWARSASQDIHCINNHRQLAAGLIAFALDHDRRFPRNEGAVQGHIGWGSMYSGASRGEKFSEWWELFNSYVDFSVTRDPSLQTKDLGQSLVNSGEAVTYSYLESHRLLMVIVCGEVPRDYSKAWKRLRYFTSARFGVFERPEHPDPDFPAYLYPESAASAVLTTCIACAMNQDSPDQNNVLYQYGNPGDPDFSGSDNYRGAHAGKWVNSSFADGHVEKFYIQGGDLYKNREKNLAVNGGSFSYGEELGHWVAHRQPDNK